MEQENEEACGAMALGCEPLEQQATLQEVEVDGEQEGVRKDGSWRLLLPNTSPYPVGRGAHGGSAVLGDRGRDREHGDPAVLRARSGDREWRSGCAEGPKCYRSGRLVSVGSTSTHVAKPDHFHFLYCFYIFSASTIG